MEQKIDNKEKIMLMNRLLNFAAISDDFSKKNTYQKLLKFFDKEFEISCTNDGDYYIHCKGEQNKEKYSKAVKMINALPEVDSDNFNIDEALEKIEKSNQENIEFLKLIKNYNTDHPVIKKIKYFTTVKEKMEYRFDYNKHISSFSGCLTPDFNPKRDSLHIFVEGQFPLKEYPLSKNELDKLRNFFEKYPSLKTFENFEEALENSSNEMNKTFESFFEKVKIMANLNDDEFNELSRKCVNLQEITKMIKNSIVCESSRGTLDNDESQPTVYFNIASLKISEIIKCSLELEKSLNHTHSNKNKRRM